MTGRVHGEHLRYEKGSGSALLHFSRNGAYEPGATELLVLDRGEGPYVFELRQRYVDGLCSLFCAQIGYSYGEEMAAVAGEQLCGSRSTPCGTAHPPALELADRLAELLPPGLNRIFFTSGGSESVESAWKIVRQYHIANGQPQRMKAIARKIAYHGVTLARWRSPACRATRAVRPAGHRHHARLQHQRLPQPPPGRGAHQASAGGDGGGPSWTRTPRRWR